MQTPIQNDEEFIRRWFHAKVNNPPKRPGSGVPLWSVVSAEFCIGSTYAAEFCRKHGADPQTTVRKIR